MKKLLPFLARLVIVSLLLVPVLPLLHRAYAAALVIGAPTGTRVIRYDGSSNLYTFLVLILAIPGMELRKRLLAVAVGIGAFLCADIFMTAVWIPYLKTPWPSLANMAVSYGWLVTAHYLLPFLLWLAFAFRQIEGIVPVKARS